jgi:hypothetical protein
MATLNSKHPSTCIYRSFLDGGDADVHGSVGGSDAHQVIRDNNESMMQGYAQQNIGTVNFGGG